MKIILIALLCTLYAPRAHALIVSEVMSNPTGDDSGREWIEIYNDTLSDIDLTSMTISIKGGAAVVTTPLQGGTTLSPGGYGVIGSVVSGATKFLQDYPSYGGPLFKSSISLVNTGLTSIDIKLHGSVAASLPSYTAAKEGFTLSYVGGGYVSGNPTPGADNQVADTTDSSNGTSTATTTENQVTLPQMTPPSADIVIYMPQEKVVVAGAESEFSVFSMTRSGKPINDLHYTWAFGDGGQRTGSSTPYRYVYSGRYVAQVEALSATVSGRGRMIVRVVPPDLVITSVDTGKYGAYVEIQNPNAYDLDLSQWMLTIDGAAHSFPKNTTLLAGLTTRFSGLAMGFASTTVSTSTTVKILFPNLEEVTRYVPRTVEAVTAASTTVIHVVTPKRVVAQAKQKVVLGVATSSELIKATTSLGKTVSKDTRIVAWLRGLFGGK